MNYLQRAQGPRVCAARSRRNLRTVQKATQRLDDAAQLIELTRKHMAWQAAQLEEKDATIWRLQQLLLDGEAKSAGIGQ